MYIEVDDNSDDHDRGVCDFNPPPRAKECSHNDDDRIDGFNNISIHIHNIIRAYGQRRRAVQRLFARLNL